MAPPLRATRSAAIDRPKSGPGVARRLVERLEDAVALVGGESGAGVADFDQRHVVGADRGEANGLRPAGFGTLPNQRLRGVSAQVFEHAKDMVWIGVDLETGRYVDVIIDPVRVLGAG